MKHNVFLITVVIAVVGFVVTTSAAQAAPQATYTLVQSYIGPGSRGGAGIYAVSSSIGQPGAGEVSAGSYTLGGGFWGGGIIVPAQSNYDLYWPLLLR